MEDTTDVEVRFDLVVDSRDQAREIDALVQGSGGTTETEAGADLLPTVVLLAIVIPPGVGLLAKIFNDIAHSWKDCGTLIDRSGDRPTVRKDKSVPYGSVFIVSNDAVEVKRAIRDSESAGEYLERVLTALTRGKTAKQADAEAVATA